MEANISDYRDVWTDADFPDMGWHDACVYSLSFPQANQSVTFDIDYIFKWHWEGEMVRGWDVAPCTLEFTNVSNLKIALSWEDQGDTTIQNITRNNCRPTPNKKLTIWDYVVELDVGHLTFSATGYTQTSRMRPVFSTSQSLPRGA
ncbi:hypothetical protein HGO38_30560 [Rhizobium sp. CG5]|uniref:hypothetical protein n=1 Tax=Rhizobium sp. CG5 TaxID=2726076 RepID=UPI002034160C|nr:hypothetical protein [Rhizobium sp. CG5]MCM2477791.1 hypothetical protein [Rhizobium sp. CG5]